MYALRIFQEEFKYKKPLKIACVKLFDCDLCNRISTLNLYSTQPTFSSFFCIYVISLFEDVKCCGKNCEAKLTFIHTRYLIFLLGTLTASFVLHFLLISQGNVMFLTWINFPCHISLSACKFSSFIFLECQFGSCCV